MHKKLKTVMILICAVIVGLIIFIWIAFEFYIKREIRNANVRVARLLYQTDYNDLLVGCKQTLKEVSSGKLMLGQYNIRGYRDPNTGKFPQIILGLEPTYVYVSRDKVLIELEGGMVHSGVCAIADTNNPFAVEEKLGDIKLVDGLWYYDDGFKGDQNWAEKLKKLKPKNVKTMPPSFRENNQRLP